MIQATEYSKHRGFQSYVNENPKLYYFCEGTGRDRFIYSTFYSFLEEGMYPKVLGQSQWNLPSGLCFKDHWKSTLSKGQKLLQSNQKITYLVRLALNIMSIYAALRTTLYMSPPPHFYLRCLLHLDHSSLPPFATLDPINLSKSSSSLTYNLMSFPMALLISRC